MAHLSNPMGFMSIRKKKQMKAQRQGSESGIVPTITLQLQGRVRLVLRKKTGCLEVQPDQIAIFVWLYLPRQICLNFLFLKYIS
jgi:hypothetical protein